jgi:hypothetical protein
MRRTERSERSAERSERSASTRAGPEAVSVGPVIDGNSIRPKDVHLDPKWKYGMRPESAMCSKVGQPGYDCAVEFDLVTPEDVEEYGLPKGTKAVLHKCVRPGSAEGKFVPVETAKDALDAAKKFCKCVKANSVSERKRCARK